MAIGAGAYEGSRSTPTMSYYVKMLEVLCPTCGHRYDVSEDHLKTLLRNHKSVFCPQGDTLPTDHIKQILEPQD
jgi:hypothetical protein